MNRRYEIVTARVGGRKQYFVDLVDETGWRHRTRPAFTTRAEAERVYHDLVGHFGNHLKSDLSRVRAAVRELKAALKEAGLWENAE